MIIAPCQALGYLRTLQTPPLPPPPATGVSTDSDYIQQQDVQTVSAPSSHAPLARIDSDLQWMTSVMARTHSGPTATSTNSHCRHPTAHHSRGTAPADKSSAQTRISWSLPLGPPGHVPALSLALAAPGPDLENSVMSLHSGPALAPCPDSDDLRRVLTSPAPAVQ